MCGSSEITREVASDVSFSSFYFPFSGFFFFLSFALLTQKTESTMMRNKKKRRKK
jgi:hypothetical protein